MSTVSPLHLFYLNQPYPNDISSPLDNATKAILENESFELDEIFHSNVLWQTPLSDAIIVDNWKNFLTLALINKFSTTPSKDISKSAYVLLNQPWNQQSQFLKTLIALSQSLVGIPVLDIHLEPLSGGAVPIQMHEYCPWSAIPYRPFHIEMSTLVVLLAHMTHEESLSNLAHKLAAWHLNMLDAQFLPIVGLFVQEKDGSLTHLLMWNYLLFHSMANLLGEKKFKVVAEAQLGHLQNLFEKKKFFVPPMIPLVEKMVEQYRVNPKEDSLPLEFPERVIDPTMALVGVRTLDSHVMCTLHGSNTGLGSMRYKDVSIVNYGPQYLPLDECQGFGIEGNFLSEHGIRKSFLNMKEDYFALHGCVRVIDQPSSDSMMGKLRGIWIETQQEHRAGELSLKTQFLGFNGWDDLVFSFFIKANGCRVDEEILLKPQMLNHFDGPARSLVLEGKEGNIHLSTNAEGIMKIVPLGGGNDFWGADFLVAYVLDSNQKKYEWEMKENR